MISIPLIHYKNSSSVVTVKLALSKSLWRAIRLFLFILLLTSMLIYFLRELSSNSSQIIQNGVRSDTRLILVTPTYKRTERLADLTRLAQTLMHVPNLHWILVEDGTRRVEAVERILKRSKIPFSYIVKQTEAGFPGKGWPQRNAAMDYIRQHYAAFNVDAVLYFADDDNSYDLRLFSDYLPHVKTIGLWAVGLVRQGFIEAPRVRNASIVGWDAWRTPEDVEFAIDMAGFGIHLDLVLRKKASFHRHCSRAYPEDCFLRQFDIPLAKCQPFGHNSTPMEVLVWHTKTHSLGTNGSTFGYVIAE